MAIFSFFWGIFLLYSLLIMKAPVDRTKQLRDLKFGIWVFCSIGNRYLSPFLKILKTTSGFDEKSKLATKYAIKIKEYRYKKEYQSRTVREHQHITTCFPLTILGVVRQLLYAFNNRNCHLTTKILLFPIVFLLGVFFFACRSGPLQFNGLVFPFFSPCLS